MSVAAEEMTGENFERVINGGNVQTSMARLEMWADNPAISHVLFAAYVLMM